MIEIAALSKRYGAFTAVRSLDLVVPDRVLALADEVIE